MARPIAAKEMSPHSKASVEFLRKTPEYKHFEATKVQEASFVTMWGYGVALLIGLVYFDVMVNLFSPKFPQGLVGSLLNLLPKFLWPLPLLPAFLAASWVTTSVWSVTYHDRRHIVTVFAVFRLASLVLSMIPFRALTNAPPFFDAYRGPQLDSITTSLDAAFFVAGLILFVPRYTGFWKHRSIARVPALTTAPAMLLAAAAAWYLITSLNGNLTAVSLQHIEQWVTETVSWYRMARSQQQRPLTLPVIRETLETLHPLAVSAYRVLVLYSFTVTASRVVVHHVIPPLVSGLMSLLSIFVPSTRSLYVLAVAGILFYSVRLHRAGTLDGMTGLILGSCLTFLLVRGYPAE